MPLWTLLRSEATAWVMGGVAVAVVATIAFSWLGWLGIGLVGLFGLLITTRLTLHGGFAVPDNGFGSGPVGLLAKQIEAQSAQSSSPEQKAAAEAERTRRARISYAINTVFIGMLVLGLVLFFQHQI